MANGGPIGTIVHLTLQWLQLDCRSKAELVVRVEHPETTTVRHLLQALLLHETTTTTTTTTNSTSISLAGPEAGGSGRLRLLQVHRRRIMSIVAEDAPVASLLLVPFGTEHRVEEIPLDQLAENVDAEKEVLIPCVHVCSGSLAAAVGRPFLVKVCDEEDMSTIATRIQKMLQVPDAVFEKWRIAMVYGTGFAVEVDKMDIQAVKELHGEQGWSPRLAIGLIHGLKKKRRRVPVTPPVDTSASGLRRRRSSSSSGQVVMAAK